MEGINKIKSLGIVAGIIMLAVGIIFMVFSVQVTAILGWLVGIGILVVGVIRLLQALTGSSEEADKKHKVGRIILSVAMIIIGVFLLINVHAAISLVGIVIGIFAFAAAVDRFVVANECHKAGLPMAMAVISGVIHILFGVLMICASFLMINMLVIFTGAYLMVSGILITISAVVTKDLDMPE